MGSRKAPNWPTKLLIWYCGEEAVEDLLGDIEEVYFLNLKSMSPLKAKVRYILQALSLLFSYAIQKRRTKSTGESFNWTLLGSYSKIAIRSLSRQRTFSIINAICLSTGMSIGLLALAAWMDVFEVDDFQTKRDRIYRVITHVDDKNRNITLASASAPLSENLKEVSGIEEVVTINSNFKGEAEMIKNSTIPLAGYYATDNFFDVFDFKLESGSAATALTRPFSIILTKETSVRLFGNYDPIGKVVPVKGLGEFTITGVVENFHRSHFLFDALVSFSTIEALKRQGKFNDLDNWGPRTDFYSYLLLSPGKAAAEVETLLDQIIVDKFDHEKNLVVTADLQAFEEIPTSDLINEIGLQWGLLSLSIFIILALLVLLPACFNYSNISIARALKRAKEIGLRKVAGGQSKNIFFQMIMETVILSIVSLIGGILIFVIIRDEFLSMIVEGRKTFDFEITPLTFLIFLLFAILTGVLAGIFPATYFSKLNPIETLRSSTSSGKLSKVSVRKGLIVFQFTLSLVFILGVVILGKQYKHALNFEMGFEKENILEVPLKGSNQEIFKSELNKLSEVREVSLSSSIPGSWNSSSIYVTNEAKADSLEVYQMFVDDKYLETLEIPLLAGKNFSDVSAGEEEFIIVNQAFLKDYKIEDVSDALDHVVYVDERPLKIIGVVKDFNHMPMIDKIRSFCFRFNPDYFHMANVKIVSTDITSTLKNIEQAWSLANASEPFESYFLEDKLKESLVTFQTMLKMFGFMAALAITISCLGLLAVVISTSEGRIKEMGVRKILGATPGNLAMVLSRGFLKLIIISVLIATPISYFLFEEIFLRMHQNRVPVGFFELVVGVSFLLILIVITVGGQTLKVVRVNPVDTLKHE